MKVSENLSILFMTEKSEMSKDGLAPIYVRITICSRRKAIEMHYRHLSLPFSRQPKGNILSVSAIKKHLRWY